jgi:hypothetical protein
VQVISHTLETRANCLAVSLMVEPIRDLFRSGFIAL